MKKALGGLFILQIALALTLSCGSNNNRVSQESNIEQQKDGSFLLKIEEAECYSDMTNPSGSTAEWRFVVTNAGRYKVWLSSATIDTTNLGYSDSVKISLLDNKIEKMPACDKIVKNADGVPYPYFRTDSYMGSFYFPEPGEYNLQLISEKVMANDIASQNNIVSDSTKLMSLILIPMTR
jgi:hypothetical protein